MEGQRCEVVHAEKRKKGRKRRRERRERNEGRKEKKKRSRELSSLLLDKRRQIINNAPVYTSRVGDSSLLELRSNSFPIVVVVVVFVEFLSFETQKPDRTIARVKQPPTILHSFSQRTTRPSCNRESKLGRDALVQS